MLCRVRIKSPLLSSLLLSLLLVLSVCRTSVHSEGALLDHGGGGGVSIPDGHVETSQMRAGPGSCPSGSYLCKEPPMCVTLDDLCSESNQCTDYDEIDKMCPVECQPHKFKCLNVSQCVNKKYLCDERKDCEDGSDELNCDDPVYKCNEEADSFLCDDNSECIFYDYVCDGDVMCSDGSDEKNDCYEKCKKKKCGRNQHCVPDGEDVKCICMDGYQLDKEGKDCVDKEYCKASDFDRPCSQTCVEGYFGRGPSCRCIDGYRLQRDGRSCNATGPEAVLYVSSDSEIYQWTVQTQSFSTVIDGLEGVTALAFDSLENRIFWIEKPLGEVYSMSLKDEKRTKTVVASFGLKNPESLAYDYVTKNLYIVDSGIPAIWACELLQPQCVTVLNDSMLSSPKDIVLNPAQGLMYFTEAGKDATIMRASMDGKNLTKLVPFIHDPVSLHIDLTTERLYWIEKLYNVIFKVDLDGQNKKSVKIVNKSPEIMSIFEDNIFFVSQQSNAILTANKFTGEHTDVLFDKLHHKPTALVVDHKSLQNDHVINRCHSNRCHLCLLHFKQSGSCFCARGYHVAATQQYCERKEAHSVLLASDRNRILWLPLNTTGRPTPTYISANHMNNMYALAYMSKSHEILYSDVDTFGIPFIGKVQGIDTVPQSSIVVTDLVSVQSIAVDEASSLVFWTDPLMRSINVAYMKRDYKVKLPISATRPYSVCVETSQGILYYVERENQHKKAEIIRCRIDGQHCATLVSERLSRPLYLVVDGQTLYWSDFGLGEISSINQFGKDRTKIVVTNGEPMYFAVDKNVLYWTERNSSNIFYKHIYDGSPASILPIQGTGLTGLIAAVPHTLPESPCSYGNGGCEQICISINRNVETSCLCTEGFHLHQDRKRCVLDNMTDCTGFLCKSGESCIDNYLLCDNVKNCHDGSDESEEQCPPSHCFEDFVCQNGQCIDNDFVCDGEYDCKDGSDESDCNTKCSAEEHGCDKNKCIPQRDVCDRFKDCDDGSDEQHCECTEHQFKCGNNHCIPVAWKCDGFEDCDNGEDEFGCVPVACGTNEYKCRDGECVEDSDLCDCVEGDDEEGCGKPCLDNEFQCYDGECIPQTALCDNTPNCNQHEDEYEENCDKCSDDDFPCGHKLCIPSLKVCDGKHDCPDRSDEMVCIFKDGKTFRVINETKTETPCDGFVCGVGNCIDAEKRCDGKIDCRDSTDEVNCVKTCKSFNRCSQICKDTMTGIECECRNGYQLVSDGFACEDVNECLFENGGCSQSCINIKGLAKNGFGFKCHCFEGYLQGHDYYSCKAEGRRPEVYTSTATGIRKITFEGMSLHESMVIPTKRMAKDLKIDIRRNSIYWIEYGDDHVNGDNSVWVKRQHNEPEVLYTGHVYGLELDWITGNLYLLNQNTTSGQLISVLTKSGLLSPLGNFYIGAMHFLLHPKRALMFWMTPPPLRVIRASMDGSGSHVIYEHVNSLERFLSPFCLDVTTDRLYVVHQLFTSQLISMRIDGTDVTHYDLNTHGRKFRSMDIFEGIAFFTSKDNSVKAFATYNHGKGGVVTVSRISYPIDITINHLLRQPLDVNLCDSSKCMYMCIRTTLSSTKCMCPRGYENVENPNCEGPAVDIKNLFSSTTSAEKTIPWTTPDTITSTTATSSVVQVNKSLVFQPMACSLKCKNGGKCVTSGNSESCSCPKEFGGLLCEKRETQSTDGGDDSVTWVAGLVVGLLFLLFIVMVAVWYFRYKRHNQSLMGSIRFKKQNKFTVCHQDDKDGLVPEISFCNPGFQEGIDEEAHLQEDQDWWKKLISRSRRSVDSAFHSKNNSQRSILDDCIDGYLKGDPQDPGMCVSDKIRLLK